MKRKILSAFAAITTLLFASCSMFNTIDSNEENNIQESACITIGVEQGARTALPTVGAAQDFDIFSLTGTATTGNAVSVSKTWASDATSTAYAKMTASSIAVTAGASYSFSLTAKKDGATYQGSAEKQIAQGTNSLSFTLTLTSLATDGEGAISVVLTVPESVKAASAALTSMDGSTTLSPENASLTFAGGKASYTASGIASGNYALTFTLWGNEAKTLKLGEWKEYAGITKGLTSTSAPAISSADELESIYQITLNTNGGTLTGTTAGSYTRFSDTITLPTSTNITKDANVFKGWKETDSSGNASGETITGISSGSVGDKTIAAQWTESGIYAASGAFYINVDAETQPASGNGAW